MPTKKARRSTKVKGLKAKPVSAKQARSVKGGGGKASGNVAAGWDLKSNVKV